MSKVGIFGAGWVGLVTGACFAELGHDVVIRDVVPEKIATLQAGHVPFHEVDVPELLARNAERLTYTLDVNDVAAVWYRRAIYPAFYESASLSERIFASGELRHLVFGMVWNPRILWVNPIDKVYIAEQRGAAAQHADHDVLVATA